MAVDIFTVALQAHDKLLLCSDGVWEMVHEADLENIMSTSTFGPSQMVDAIVEASLNGGGRDNVSVIVVFAV